MRRWRSELGPASAAAGLTALVLVPVLQLWRADLSVPFLYRADANFYGMVVKGILEHGGYNHNSALGAPFGQALADFPQGPENFHLLVIRVIGLFTSSYAAAVNVYFLLMFPLTALTAYFVLRWLRLGRPVSVVFAVLFAFLPYHFVRGEEHLFLGGYVAVPLGLHLALAVLDGRPLFARRFAGAAAGIGRIAQWATGRTLLTLAICAVVGSASIYYAVFTVLLVTAGAAVAAVRSPGGAAYRSAVVVVAAVAGVVGLNLTPTVLYRLRHGPNQVVAVRVPSESEIFGLKITQLVLPAEGHRLQPLAALADRYRTTTQIPSEEGQALGLLGSAGFLLLLGVAVGAMAPARDGPGPASRWLQPAHRPLAILTLVAVVVATIGGFSSLFAYLVTPQIRSWSRMSVYIGFLALAAVALVVDRAAAVWTERRPSRAALAGGLAALLCLGLLDQTNGSMVPHYAAIRAEFRSDVGFVRALEQRLPRRAMLFQLPVRPFPEAGPLEGMVDYDQLRGYLHSRHLRWSYGGIKGREADWQGQLEGQPPGLLVARLATAGFAGITIDRYGYVDRGAGLEGDLTALLGPPVVSRDGRQSFFPLGPSAERLRATRPAGDLEALAAGTLHPVLGRWGAGFGRLRQEHGSRSRTLAAGGGRLYLENPGATPRRIVLDVTLEPVGPGATAVEVRYPDGRSETVHLGADGARLHREFPTGPGEQAVDFTVPPAPSAPPGVRTEVGFTDPAVYDAPPPGFG